MTALVGYHVNKRKAAHLISLKHQLSSTNLPGLQDMVEVSLLLAARAVLGFFAALVLGTVIYILSLLFALSIWAATSVSFNVIGILTASIGTILGGFFSWLDRDLSRSRQLTLLGLTVVFALAGAWAGLLYGEGVTFKFSGLPGIPVLSIMIIGSAVGANIPSLALVKTARRESGLKPFQSLAKGLRKDIDAVRLALAMTWSNA